jgi:UDP-2-acetamido-2-deoxy-ribo-hexuluronate aminotransferase
MNFIDLQEQYRRYRGEIDAEVARVMESAQFIMGPAVGQLETELARHTGVAHAIGCSSGTDALILCLLAKGIKPGDEILVPDFTFFATAEVVAFLGARPVFVDVEEDTFCIDPTLLEAKITPRTKGIIPVSLFGQCADLDAVGTAAKQHGLWVLEDAAQSYGALSNGRRSGSIANFSATSFFPAKPLGCYGDGGAVFTNDDGIAKAVRELLNHGQSERYKHSSIGMNGRLDTIQAAVLRVKLRHFDEEMVLKRAAADRYTDHLAGLVSTPKVRPGNESVWAQYTIRSPKRDQIIDHLKSRQIPTAIHYPVPLHAQAVFASHGLGDRQFPVSCRVSQTVVSLPMHPFLIDANIDHICDAIREALR